MVLIIRSFPIHIKMGCTPKAWSHAKHDTRNPDAVITMNSIFALSLLRKCSVKVKMTRHDMFNAHATRV